MPETKGLLQPDPPPNSEGRKRKRISRAEYAALTPYQKTARQREQERLRQRARRTRQARIRALLDPTKERPPTKSERKGRPGRPIKTDKPNKKQKATPASSAAKLKFGETLGTGPTRRPTARGRNLHLTTQLRWILLQPDPDNPAVTIGRQILQTAADAAKAGHFAFFKEIIDRIDGKVPERLMIDMTERLVRDQAANLCHTLLVAVEGVTREFLPEDRAGEFVMRIGEKLYNAVRNGHGKPALTLNHGNEGLDVLLVDASPVQEEPGAPTQDTEGADHDHGGEATTDVSSGVPVG